jgi:hypothetical protein
VEGFEDLFPKGCSTHGGFGLALGRIIFVKSSVKATKVMNKVRKPGINIEVAHLLSISFFIQYFARSLL